MQTKIIVVLIGLSNLLFNFAQAQKRSFAPGYYINVQGDSISGYVLFDFDRKSDNLPQFKIGSDTQNPQVLTADKVRRVGWHTGLYYETRQFNSNNQTTFIFLRALVRGEVNLYESLAQEDIDNQYFVEQQDQLTRINPIGLNNFINVYFKKCSAVVDKARRYKYDKYSLVKLVADYNQCVNPAGTNDVFIKQVKTNFQLGGKVFYNTGYFKLHRRAIFDFGKEKEYGFSNAGLGASLTMMMGNLGAQFELAYARHQASQDSVRVLQEYSTLDLKFDYLELPLSLRYRIKTQVLDLYPTVGLHPVFILNDTFTETISSSSSVLPRTQPFVQSFDKTRFAFGITAGVELGKDFSNGSNVFVHVRQVWIDSEYRQIPVASNVQSDLLNRKIEIAIGYRWSLKKS